MLTNEMICALEGKGFKRWTKGNLDRMYVNASQLGLVCDYYKTGNIRDAEFNGSSISNSEARRMKAAKTFVDIATGNVHSDSYTLEQTVKELLESMMEGSKNEA